jgi:hypothetical protein
VFRLSESGQQIIKALKDVLQAHVRLFDAEKREHHLAMTSGWFSHPGDDAPADDTPGCRVKVAINDRWTLTVFKRRDLHPDAETIATWAAKKLAPYLPRRTANLDVPPARGGGGTSGSAELGIPLWWARKHRS